MSAGEADLVRRVLQAFLREDLLPGPATAPVGEAAEAGPGEWLTVAGPAGVALLVPVERGGLLADLTVRATVPVLRRPGTVMPLPGIDAVLAAVSEVRAGGDATLALGLAEFRAECQEALLAQSCRPARPPTVDAAAVSGPAGLVRLDAFAAHAPHPFHPTSAAREGFDAAAVRAYAPEWSPQFELPWVAVPSARVVTAGRLPPWWPDVGPDRFALPVHPWTAGRLPRALPEEAVRLPAAALPAAALADRALPARVLTVTPTLSLRTVAVLGEPELHVKLPLPTSTLGRRNRRGLRAGSLHDGAWVADLLEAVRRQDPAVGDLLLLADESTWAHAGDDMLAVMLRRHPADVDAATIVPVAALAADLPGTRPVVSCLADRFTGGDVASLLVVYLDALLRLHLTLWLRHGIALEAHQQNSALVLDHAGGQVRARLLLKDNDSPRLDLDLVRASLGGAVPQGAPLDRRVCAADPGQLADMVTTITLHLCAAAVVVGAATGLGLPWRTFLPLLRDRLVAAASEHGGARDHALLQDVLAAERLPVKRMVTAGTLLPKERLGVSDVNTAYGAWAPSYLRAAT